MKLWTNAIGMIFICIALFFVVMALRPEAKQLDTIWNPIYQLVH